MAEQDALDDGADDGFLVVVEVLDGPSRHRTQITADNPRLAQKAGRAFQTLVTGKDHGRHTGPIIRTGRMKGHRLTTRAVIKAQPDLGKVASALIEIARAKLEDEKKEAA